MSDEELLEKIEGEQPEFWQVAPSWSGDVFDISLEYWFARSAEEKRVEKMAPDHSLDHWFDTPVKSGFFTDLLGDGND
jgi:hypothetical protein